MHTEVSDILLDTYSDTRQYTESFSISAKELKTAFTEIKDILAKSVHSKAIAFKSEEGKLQLRCSNGVEYVAHLNVVKGSIETNFDLACEFKDIGELIPGTGEVEVFLTPVYIGFEAKGLVADLQVDNTFVNTTPKIQGKASVVDLMSLKKGLSQLMSLNLLATIYKQNNSILFAGNMAQIRYPAVWVETRSSGLNTALDIQSCNILNSFLKTAREVVKIEGDKFVAIRKNGADLFIPKQDVVQIKDIETVSKDYTYIGEWSFKGLKTKVQNALRSIGKSDATVYLFDNYTEVSINQTSVKLKIKVGDKTTDNPFDKFTMRLEFLNTLINLLGEKASVYGKGDFRKIENSQIKVLLSTKG